jgi:hypothetical protein
MAQLKMSWHTEGDRLADEWVESQVTESYSPPWMQSSYPYEANAEQCSTDQLLSLFGTPRY